MSFIAKPNLKDPELWREFQRIAEAFKVVHQHPVLRAEPSKPRVGMVVYADGTDWNPDASSGEGLYVYKSTGWEKL